MSSIGAGNNASDVGLIVQGTLIFLSAVVAVAGCKFWGKNGGGRGLWPAAPSECVRGAPASLYATFCVFSLTCLFDHDFTTTNTAT